MVRNSCSSRIDWSPAAVCLECWEKSYSNPSVSWKEGFFSESQRWSIFQGKEQHRNARELELERRQIRPSFLCVPPRSSKKLYMVDRSYIIWLPIYVEMVMMSLIRKSISLWKNTHPDVSQCFTCVFVLALSETWCYRLASIFISSNDMCNLELAVEWRAFWMFYIMLEVFFSVSTWAAARVILIIDQSSECVFFFNELISWILYLKWNWWIDSFWDWDFDVKQKTWCTTCVQNIIDVCVWKKCCNTAE